MSVARQVRRLAVIAVVAVTGLVATAPPALAASSHQYVKVAGRNAGDVWYNAGLCCVPQRNSFTLKDWYRDGYKVCVAYKINGVEKRYTMALDARNSEVTFSIAPNPTHAEAFEYRGCVVNISTNKVYYNTYTVDFIE